MPQYYKDHFPGYVDKYLIKLLLLIYCNTQYIFHYYMLLHL